MASGVMSKEEREAFLEGVHVAILAIDEPGRGPLALPVWYQWVDGTIEISMEGGSRKAELLRAAGRATVVVQQEELPYRYVSVQGPVEVVPREGDESGLAIRYLGEQLGRAYVEGSNTVDPVIARLTPETWRTFDYGKALS